MGKESTSTVVPLFHFVSINQVLSKKKQSKVLDFGCGNGELISYLSSCDINLDGYDVAAEMVRLAKEKNPYNHILESVYEISTDYYDIVILNLVISAVEEALDLLAIVNRVLKPGGQLYCSVSHPCFSLVSSFHHTTRRKWLNESNESNELFLYFSNPTQMIYWDDANFTHYYYRTITDYFSMFRQNGFLVDEILEPKPIPEGSFYKDLYELHSKIPAFMVFLVTKV